MASAFQALTETTEKTPGFACTELRGAYEQYDGGRLVGTFPGIGRWPSNSAPAKADKYYVHLTLIRDERGRLRRKVKLQRGLFVDVETALLAINGAREAYEGRKSNLTVASGSEPAPALAADTLAPDADAPAPDAGAPAPDADAPLTRGRSWAPRQGTEPAPALAADTLAPDADAPAPDAGAPAPDADAPPPDADSPASPLYKSDAGKWGLRFLKQKNAHHTKGTRTWASKADGAKFDTEEEATAAIVDWWTAEEQYKGNATQCAALARASAEPPVGLASVAFDEDEAAAADPDADAAAAAASDDDALANDARDAARASDDPPVGVAGAAAEGAAVDGGVAAADDASDDDASEDDAADDMLQPPPKPKPLHVFQKPRSVDAGLASKRARSSFSDGNVNAKLVELFDFSREALRVQLAAAAATVERRAMSVDERNEELLPHVDRLSAALCTKMTHTLLVGYDEKKDFSLQFTAGQLKHCEAQCSALHDYLSMIVEYNTGDPGSGGLAHRQCASKAATRTHGAATAATIQKWYNHNYVANEGLLAPRDSGLYKRDTFVEWFVQQSGLVSRFVAALKANLRHMSLQKAADLLIIVLDCDYEDAEDAINDEDSGYDAGDEAAGDGTERDGAPVDGAPADGAPADGAPADGAPGIDDARMDTTAPGPNFDGTPRNGDGDGAPGIDDARMDTTAPGPNFDGTPRNGAPRDDAPRYDAPRDGAARAAARPFERGKGRKRQPENAPKPEWYKLPSSGRAVNMRVFLLNRFGIQWPLSKGGTLRRILAHPAVEAKYVPYTKSYYTDSHEKQVEYRLAFLLRDTVTELLAHKWIQLPLDEALAVIAQHKETNPFAEKDLEPHYFTAHTDAIFGEGGNQYVEFNVNSSAAFESFATAHRLGGNLSVRNFPTGVPRRGVDPKPVIVIGQDEKTYAAFAYPQKAWTVGGVIELRPKTDVPKEMCSGWVSRVMPFGFPLNQLQLDAVNVRRANTSYPSPAGCNVAEARVRLQTKEGVRNPTGLKPALVIDPLVQNAWHRDGMPDEAQYVCAPGARWLSVGKANEGYWTHDHTIVHTVDMIDVFDELYGKYAEEHSWYIGYECQAMFHFDWSSGHGALKVGGLNAKTMAGGYGGAQAMTRDAPVERENGYLGPYDAKMKIDGAEVDCKLRPGETQSGTFNEVSRPPFYDADRAPGTGIRDEARKAPAGAKDYAATKKALEENTDAKLQLAASGWDFDGLNKNFVEAYVRVRTPPPPKKNMAPVPKGLKAALVLEARRLYSESAAVVLVIGEPPAGFDVWTRATESVDESGWLNEAKGLKHYLWERGFWHPSNTQTLDGALDATGAMKGWKAAASLCDFQNEATQLQQLICDLGHQMDKTPKCQPEIAGEGIELDLRCNALQAQRPEILSMQRLRRSERMVWRYKMVYRAFAVGGANPVEHREIERLQCTMKKHRGCDYELRILEGKVVAKVACMGDQ
ncbi:hypothetical protein M885DRAFT_577847 [Pelagophyceae sp. CCMP2097]|nr:hypothetical protein M885DRAFT_577847 [Pelagophyceae sp. CCMP2097]